MATAGRTICPGAFALDRRSQSEALGVVLVVGLVMVSATGVVLLGATAIGGTESQLSDDRAEKTLTQFDSKAGLVALGQADSQRVTLPIENDEQYRVEEDRGLLNITVYNLTDGGGSFTVINTTLGAVIYEKEDSQVAYQGGGVWRASDGGGKMISPPEFHYRNGTLTLPAVTVTGGDALGSSAVITRDGEDGKFPLTSVPDRLNPLDNHRVEVTVQSEYYRGWGHYFVERTEGSVEYDHEAQEVTVTLVTPVSVDEITAASASLSAGGEFNVSGTSASTCWKSGADDVYTSSFDSSNGSYCDQFDGANKFPPGTAGDVVYGKDIDISDGSGGSSFYGDLTSGGTITVKKGPGGGQPTVWGNISYVEDCRTDDSDGDCEKRIEPGSGGQVWEIDDVKVTESIDWFVNNTVHEIEEHADEVNPPIDGETLEAGEYYFDSFDLSDGSELELNTSEGTVVLGVKGDVSLDEDAEIEVTGDDHVELFVGGTSGTDFTMANDAEITAENDNGTQFRLYGKSDFDARLGGGGNGNLAVYTGVIYAPPGTSGTGRVMLDGAEVYGGILTGQATIDGGSIHYDEALEGEKIVPEEARIIRVTYLHVSESRIVISD